LNDSGYDAKHTDDLPEKERTTDNQIREISTSEDRIVISKDSDFVDSHYIYGVPNKLFLISTGNIKNKALIDLFKRNLSQIVKLFETCSMVEMDNLDIVGHE
jgi:predicted nuclease of predicted toxin-antitoxin system